MPARMISMPRARSPSIIAVRIFSVMCGAMPRSISLALSSSITRTVSSRTVPSREIVFFGQRREEGVETLPIVGSEIRSRDHARQDDIDAARAQPLDHRRQVFLGNVRRDATQHIVGAQFQNDEVGVLGNGPVE